MRRISIAFIAVLFITLVIRAQPRDRDCNPIGVPAECEEQSRAIQALEDRIAHLQQQLQSASPAAKPQWLRTITRLNGELDTAKADLSRCIREQGAPQAELYANELAAPVTGTAILETTNDNAPGPYTVDLDINVRFSRNRCDIVVTTFPTITTKTNRIAALKRRVTVEITQNGSGRGVFHPVSGRMSIRLSLHFNYKTGWTDDDDATFNLSTEDSITRNDGTVETGSALTGGGDIKLVGSGRFMHGFLAGSTGKLIVTATISPRPN